MLVLTVFASCRLVLLPVTMLHHTGTVAVAAAASVFVALSVGWYCQLVRFYWARM